MHVATQMSALRCALPQRSLDASGSHRVAHSTDGNGSSYSGGGGRPGDRPSDGPGRLTLRFVKKLESFPASQGLINSRHLPGYRMGSSHHGAGSNVPCAISAANLSAALVRKLCEYYAQDYVCLQYPLPVDCLL